MTDLIGVALIAMGVAIAGVWTRDIVVGEQIDLGAGVMRARDRDAGTLMWPHWLAEYVTAAALMVSGVGLIADASWAVVTGSAAAGALLYTSVNSLGWALAAPSRRPYRYPMVAGAVVGMVAIAVLVTR